MTSPDMLEVLLDAALNHVAFDGWTETTFEAAVADSGCDPVVARALYPRGAVDLAAAFHRRGDTQMAAYLAETDLSEMRFRDRIAAAVRYRLDSIHDKDAVRRAMTLFSLPHLAPEGVRLIWGTADQIWTGLGDTSDDINWYSKRATLSGVYSTTVLFWLGDDSEGHEKTWAFLDRRIDDVMQIEKVKAGLRDNKLLSGLMAGPMSILNKVQAPNAQSSGFPGRWTRDN